MIVLLVYKHKMFMSLLFVMLYYMTSSFPISSFASQLEYCTLKYAFGFFSHSCFLPLLLCILLKASLMGKLFQVFAAAQFSGKRARLGGEDSCWV